MDLAYSPEQEAVREAFARFFAKEASPERVREAEPLGFEERTWRGLVDMGAVAMGLPEAVGGGGAGLVDLAVVVEQQGMTLAPVPLVEAVVAARVLERVGTAATDRVDRVSAGDLLPTLAVRPVPAATDHLPLVPAGAVAGTVVALVGDRLVAVDVEPAELRTTLGSAPVADIDVAGADPTVLAEGDAAHARFAEAVDEWRTLTAVALTGLARAAVDLGVAYVKERHQFGAPIGSFQAVQHCLADVHTLVDGARLLAFEAAWAADDGEPRASALAAMASAFCGEAAEQAASTSLHLHGGYGFMLEYDIQLYFRRAKAWRLVLGDPRDEYQVVADRLYGAGAD